MTIDLLLEMPLGFSSDGDYSAFQDAFEVVTPYGLRIAPGDQIELSHALQIAVDDSDPQSRLHALLPSVLTFEPATGEGPARLVARPLPFQRAQLGQRLNIASKTPSQIIYANVEPAAVEQAISALLTAQGHQPAQGEAMRGEFMAGSRGLKVAQGDWLGRPALDPALGRRRLDLIVKDAQAFYLNPAYFLYRWPEIMPGLEQHPLLLAIEPIQHEQLFATRSRKLYVYQGSPTPTPPYASASTAAHTINDAMVRTQAGDIVIVLDNAVYSEKIFMTDGVILTSKAAIGLTGAIGELPAGFPTLNDPEGADAAVVIEDCPQGPTQVKGFIITSQYGNGVVVSDSYDVEISYNDIHHCRNLMGGGVGIFSSGKVRIQNNIVRDNQALFQDGGGIWSKYGHGGGIYVDSYSNGALIRRNKIYRNTADCFGGGIAVHGRETGIYHNIIGSATNSSQANLVRLNRLPYEYSTLLSNPQGGGGGIGVFATNAYIANNLIGYNVASCGGGIEFYDSAYGTVRRNHITRNWTRIGEDPSSGLFFGGDGGGIAVNNIAISEASANDIKFVALENNQIDYNVAGDDGGGIYGTGKAKIRIIGQENIIASNSAYNFGGGIRISFGSELTVENCEIRGNTANTAQSAEGAGGGGVAIRNSKATFKNSIIHENSVHNYAGGGIILQTRGEDGPFDLIDDLLKDAYHFDRARLTLVETAVTANAATGVRGGGGGIFVAYGEYDAQVKITSSMVDDNTAEHVEANKRYNLVFVNRNNGGVVNDTDLPPLDPLETFSQIFDG